MQYTSCPGCGARLARGTGRCDLCGAQLEVQDGDAGRSSEEGVPYGKGTSDASATGDDIPEPANPAEAQDGGVYCTACGHTNSAGSNFCSRCGARLHSPPPSQSSQSGDDPESRRDLTRHVGVLIGLAVLVVVALYMITVVSKQQAPVTSDAAVSAPAETRSAAIIQEHEAIPLPEGYRDRVDSLRTVIDGTDLAASVRARRELVDFLIGIGRVDRAAIEQQRVARITDEAPDWKKAGNLLFDWMETTEPDSKSQVALLAIDAYKQVLQQRPDDLDARADLGWAYQYDPQNPMEAIRQTNLVLEESPEHLIANYNRGVFLMRINRLDDAVKQFERVKTIAGAESPYYRQAEMWIDTIRASQTQEGAS